MRFFLMTGQSNMSGRAPLAGAPTFANAGRVHRYNQTDALPTTFINPAVEPMDDGTGEGFSYAQDTQNLFGPQLAFADKMVTHLNEDVGIISSPKGGTSSAVWLRDWSIRSPYGIALCRARRVIAAGHTIAGICHYQGESDGGAFPVEWSRNFTDFVAGMRKDLRVFLPVVFCRIRSSNPSGSWPAWNEVWAQQNSIFESPKISMVTTSDLAVQSDGLHLTQAGYVTLGVRMADAMYPML